MSTDGLVTRAEHASGGWGSIIALLELAFPGITSGIERADAVLGLRWGDVSTPFAWLEAGQPIAHVGLLRHPIRWAGEERTVAGLHAVCSHPEHRGRGRVRACMEAALERIDGEGVATAKLHTNDPDLYARWGFRVVPTVRFRWDRSGGGGEGRRLAPSRSPEDALRIVQALRQRRPRPWGFESLEGGWLAGIDAALKDLLDVAFIEVQGGLLAASPEPDGRLQVDLLADEAGLDLEHALDAFPEPYDGVDFTIDPGPLAPPAEPVPVPEADGVLMVRGPWPEDPVAISTLWEH